MFVGHDEPRPTVIALYAVPTVKEAPFVSVTEVAQWTSRRNWSRPARACPCVETRVGVHLGLRRRDEYRRERSDDDEQDRHRDEELGERETALGCEARAEAA